MKITAAVLACSLVALICVTFLFAREVSLVRDATLKQTELNEWEGRLQSVLSLLTDAETAQRGYLLTGKSRYLEPYQLARERLPDTLETLRAIATLNPALAAPVDDISKQASVKLAELAKTIRLYDEGNQANALALVRTDIGEQYMEQLRGDVATVATAIGTLRGDSSGRVVSGSIATEHLAMITVSVLIATLLLAGYQIGALMSAQARYERALRDLTDVFESTTDYVAQTDSRGKMLYINPSGRRVLGLSADASLTGRSFEEFYTPETNRRWAGEILPTVKGEGIWIGETAVLLEGNRSVPVSHMVIAHHDAQRRVARYSSLMRDISAEVAAREELARQTATLNAVVESAPAMIAVWDVDLRCRLVNRALERWIGKERAAMIERMLPDVLGQAEYERTLPWIKRALAGETVSFESEYPAAVELRHAWVTYIPLHLQSGTIAGFIGIARDITQQREENLRLQLMSERDPLTGLLNRAGFHSFLNEKTGRGEGRSLAVLYIDLDHFKPINDAHGHAMGDEVLREFAVRLLSLVRPADAVARLGGDEFGIVIAGVRETEHAARIAAKVVEMARQPVVVGDLSLRIGASIGVALNADRPGGWKDLVAQADAMAYEAKAAGRGRYALDATD